MGQDTQVAAAAYVCYFAFRTKAEILVLHVALVNRWAEHRRPGVDWMIHGRRSFCVERVMCDNE